jgi:anti-sigma factor RsiW
MSICTNAELLRDYAFDEIAAADRPGFERHLADCAACTAELDQLRLTTAVLCVLPDQEPPQRIAFVSDKAFAPSRLRSFAPWLGFVSAGVMAVALIVSSYHRQLEDARIFKAGLAASELKHEQEHRMFMDAVYVLEGRRHTEMITAEGNRQ